MALISSTGRFELPDSPLFNTTSMGFRVTKAYPVMAHSSCSSKGKSPSHASWERCSCIFVITSSNRGSRLSFFNLSTAFSAMIRSDNIISAMTPLKSSRGVGGIPNENPFSTSDKASTSFIFLRVWSLNPFSSLPDPGKSVKRILAYTVFLGRNMADSLSILLSGTCVNPRVYSLLHEPSE